MSSTEKPRIGDYRRHLLVCTGPRCTQNGEGQALFDSLGDKLKVPTLEGEETMDIPKGTQSGEVFSLRGKGLVHPGRSQRGDLLVEIIVNTPKSLSKKQEELLREFLALEEDKPLKKVKNFFKKAKDAAMGS